MAFGDTQQAAIDLTLVFDPAEVWPDPEACPEWPSRPMTDAAGFKIQGEKDARDRLAMLTRTLARAEVVRPPTEEERARARSHFFRDLDQPQAGPWSPLGLRGITYANHVAETAARQIVEALHVRGYLRRLEARRARAPAEKAERERGRHHATLDRYERRVTELQDDLTGLAAAAARHQQRLDDEVAFRKAADLRGVISGAHSEGCAAARALGVEPPPAPTVN